MTVHAGRRTTWQGLWGPSGGQHSRRINRPEPRIKKPSTRRPRCSCQLLRCRDTRGSEGQEKAWEPLTRTGKHRGENEWRSRWLGSKELCPGMLGAQREHDFSPALNTQEDGFVKGCCSSAKGKSNNIRAQVTVRKSV